MSANEWINFGRFLLRFLEDYIAFNLNVKEFSLICCLFRRF